MIIIIFFIKKIFNIIIIIIINDSIILILINHYKSIVIVYSRTLCFSKAVIMTDKLLRFILMRRLNDYWLGKKGSFFLSAHCTPRPSYC